MKIKTIILLSLVSVAVLAVALLKRPYFAHNTGGSPSKHVVQYGFSDTGSPTFDQRSESTSEDSEKNADSDEEYTQLAFNSRNISATDGEVEHRDRGSSQKSITDSDTQTGQAAVGFANDTAITENRKSSASGTSSSGGGGGAQSAGQQAGASGPGGGGAAGGANGPKDGAAQAGISDASASAIIPAIESWLGINTSDEAQVTGTPEYVVLESAPDTSAMQIADNEIAQASNAIAAGVSNTFNLDYSDEEIQQLASLYAQGKAGENPSSLVIDGTTWYYVDSPMEGHVFGDAWVAGGAYHIELGSGLGGGPAESGSHSPEPATLISALLGLFGFAARRLARKNKVV